VGFAFDHDRKESLLWVEIYPEGDLRAIEKKFSENLRKAFQQAEPYCHDTDHPSKTLLFIQPIMNDFNGNPDLIITWFRDVITEAQGITEKSAR